ncbi:MULTISPECIES: hypothetical protein [unclassified Mesorhizobium]|uniref:hypothetical protein n=1 Tax=unclassified Mesorhizobium TaxID=325217 RepID=UPI001CC9BBB0|nr:MULTISPECIES: hypothetical protein [unclassified Mesorhizobium]MBZ9739742.1 hypothetical protein [Mesorhizobium sp. CO1-1-4]MBZ9804994.1 hypothetical protein [Mesorhizobium sp. ES1-6]
MKVLAGFLVSTVLLLFAGEGLQAMPLSHASCAHAVCKAPFIEGVSHKHHHRKKQIYPGGEQWQCADGEMPDGNGNCLPVAGRRNKTQQQALPPVEQCPAGQNLNPGTGNCFSCSHNDHFENGRCVPCQQGFHVSGESCVAN